jgi:hypothetical protein
MKRSRWILGVVVLGIVGSSAGCNKAAPTEPAWGALDATAVSSQASGHSGAWSGKITFYPYYGNYVVLPCEGTELISVFLTQDGLHLTGQFQTGCAGILEIHGILTGDRIAGSLDGPSSQDYGKISGTISGNRIQFQTMKVIDEDGDGRPDGRGSPPVLSAEVELHRSPERASPIAVDRGRVPRVLPTR